MSPCGHPCMRDIVSTRVTQGDPQNTNNNNKRGPSAQCTTGQHVTPPFYLLPDQLNQGPFLLLLLFCCCYCCCCCCFGMGPPQSHAQDQFKVHLLLGCHGLEADTARFRKRKGDLEAGSSSMIYLQALHATARTPPTLWLHAPPSI